MYKLDLKTNVIRCKHRFEFVINFGSSRVCVLPPPTPFAPPPCRLLPPAHFVHKQGAHKHWEKARRKEAVAEEKKKKGRGEGSAAGREGGAEKEGRDLRSAIPVACVIMCGPSHMN